MNTSRVKTWGVCPVPSEPKERLIPHPFVFDTKGIPLLAVTMDNPFYLMEA